MITRSGEQTVEAASAKDPAKYLWFKLNKAKAHFDMHHKSHDLELEKGEKFGLKLYRGSFYLVDASDLTIQFRLNEKEAEKLVKSSKPFSGKVSRTKVQPGSWEALTGKAKSQVKPRVQKRKPRTESPSTAPDVGTGYSAQVIKDLFELVRLGSITPMQFNKARVYVERNREEVENMGETMKTYEVSDMVLELAAL